MDIPFVRELQKGAAAERIAVAFLFLVFFLLLFWNLGSEYLWWDEAESAMIAKNILHTGLPSVYDGTNLVTIGGQWMNALDYNAQLIHTHHTWLPYYITAFSFQSLGQSNFAARAPFALFGFLSIVLWYFILKDRLSTRWLRLLFLFLMVASVPLLAHFRQGRYYSLTCLLFGLAFYSYLKFKEKKTPSATALFILSNVLLFHSANFVFSVAVFCAFCVHYLFFQAKEERTDALKRLVLIGCAYALLTIPWLVYSGTLGKTGASAGPELFWQNLLDYVKNFGDFLFYPLIIIAFILLVMKKQSIRPDSFFWLISLCVVLPLLTFSFMGFWALRLVIPLVPLLFLASASLLDFIHKNIPWLSYALAAYVVLSVLLFPPAILLEKSVLLPSPQLWYYYGLFNEKTGFLLQIDYNRAETLPVYAEVISNPPRLFYSCAIGPIMAMKQSGSQTIKMNTMEIPAMYYTGLKTYFCHDWSNVSCAEFTDPSVQSDYIIIVGQAYDAERLNLINITKGYSRLKLACSECYIPTAYSCMAENPRSNVTMIYVRNATRALELGYELEAQ